MGLFGPPNIAKLEKNRNIKGLIKALQHPNEEIVINAAQALGRLKDTQAVEPLSGSVPAGTGSSKVRNECIIARLELGDLGVLIRSIDLFSRKDTLSHIFHPDLYASVDQQQRAASAIRRMGGVAFDFFYDKIEKFGGKQSRGVLVPGEFEVTPALIGLGIYGDSRVFDFLSALVQNQYTAYTEANRIGAAEGLGWLGDTRAVQPLIRALTDSDVRVTESAAYALGMLGDKWAVIPLLAALISLGGANQGRFEATAVVALAAIGDPRTSSVVAAYNAYLQSLSGQSDFHYGQTREEAKKVLQEIGGPQVEQEMKRYLN